MRQPGGQPAASRGSRAAESPAPQARGAARRPQVTGAGLPFQAPPPRAVTFHFGEGQDRTVAGAERGHPGRVLLHDEPSACRSAAADRLHAGAGWRAPRGPGGLLRGGARAAGRPGPAFPGCRVRAGLTAAAAPRSASPPAAQPLRTRAHSLPLRGCRKLQRHVQVRSPLPPRGLTCSAPRPGPPSPAARLPPSEPGAGCSLRAAGRPAAPRQPLPFPATSAGEGGPANLASALHKFKRGVVRLRTESCLLPAQIPELLVYGAKLPAAGINVFE